MFLLLVLVMLMVLLGHVRDRSRDVGMGREFICVGLRVQQRWVWDEAGRVGIVRIYYVFIEQLSDNLGQRATAVWDVCTQRLVGRL